MPWPKRSHTASADITTFFTKKTRTEDDAPADNEIQNRETEAVPPADMQATVTHASTSATPNITGQPPFPEYVDIATTKFRETREDTKLAILLEGSKHPKGWDSNRFPSHNITGKQRKFNCNILKSNPWMRYSVAKDSVFCAVCCMFGQGGGNCFCKEDGQNDWKNLSTFITRHLNVNGAHHKFATDAANFVRSMTQNRDIISIVSTSRRERIERNRATLKEVIKNLIMLGRQNIAIRGHTPEDSNFIALLNRVAASNTILRNHLQNAPRNATYLSLQVQNEIIELCGKRVRNAIVAECNRAQCFSLLADEATDTATLEQVCICVRYVHREENGDVEVKEEFLGFKEAPGRTTGEVIANLLLETLEDYRVDTTNGKLRGQGYDGASNMSGVRQGVQARVSQVHPNAAYVHCQSHALNLCIVHGCDDCIVKDVMSKVQEIAFAFSYSAKRQYQLKQMLSETPEAEEEMGKRRKLRTLCETRWSARADALSTFKASFDVVVKALEFLHTIKDSKARNFLNTILAFEFVMALVACEWLLQFIVPLTNYLQTVDIDLLQAHQQTTTIIDALAKQRNDESWEKLYQHAVAIAEKHDVPVIRPRLAGRQQHRVNVPSNSVSDYYKRGLYFPFLDHLLSELNDRLIKPGPLFRISCLLPRNVGKWSPAATTVDEIFTPYDADIPEHLQQVRESECMRWKSRWEKANDLPGTLHDTLEQCSPHEFPNIAKAFTVLLTLPITTATAERSFSALGRLKTYMRSTMKEERLNGLALMHIHKHDIQIDTEEIINEFAAASPRRLELLF